MPNWVPSPELADRLFGAANTALIVGLIISAVATVGAVWMANVKEGYLKRDLASADARIEDARAEVAKANAAGEAARAAAAEATKIAEQERLERVKIEEKLADRVVTDGDFAHVVEALKNFAGQEYDVTTFWDMREPLALANRIHAALGASGWMYVKPDSGTFLLGGLEGIEVFVHPGASDRSRAAAATLVGVLNGAGLAARPKATDAASSASDKIHLNVGTKPQ